MATPMVRSPVSAGAPVLSSEVLPAPLPEHAARESAKIAPTAAMVIRRIAVLLLVVEERSEAGPAVPDSQDRQRPSLRCDPVSDHTAALRGLWRCSGDRLLRSVREVNGKRRIEF